MNDNELKTKIILFTSCKGGVGKSTVCANLAMTMAQKGLKILMIDCDFGNRCLDLISGIDAVYDFGDVISGRIDASRAIVRDKRCPSLHFIAAPNSFDMGVSIAAFRSAIGTLSDLGGYDYIFLDSPGAVGPMLTLASNVADMAYIIVEPSRTAIRAAEHTAAYLYGKGIRMQRLIINKLTGKSISEAKKQIIYMIDASRVRLIGVVPFDGEILRASEGGKLTDELYSVAITRAFDNIAERTLGKNVALFHGIRKLKTIK